MATASKRLSNEMKQICDDLDGINQSTGGSMYIFRSSPYNFQCVLKGPDGSPYDGGVFCLSMDVPVDYPLKPPKIYFQTPIWHPNVHFETGLVGLSLLSSEWNPQWTLQSILLMLWSALKDPILAPTEMGSNFQATLAYREDSQDYINTAQQYTRQLAGSEPEQVTRQRTLERLVQMGFERTMAQEALERQSWCEDAAVTELLTLITAGDEPSACDSSYSFVHEFSQLTVATGTTMQEEGWIDITPGNTD